MANRATRSIHRGLEAALWLGSLSGVGYLALSGWQAQSALAAARKVVAAPAQERPAEAVSVPNTALMGRLAIPALGLTVPLLADDDTKSLVKGVGHIPGTAFPGGLGTMGLAGHRDTWFRPLRRIGKGMEILVTDAGGTFHYRVDSTEIVTPEQVDVLDIVDRPGMALVTCYPFDFIGAAPRRFIVHAHLVSASPDAAP